ncbi:hypothetical protein [Geomesophilobacter sediminis]|uniref:Uncharacterized protein n=1 Tax=Geomesophilobacter sediminis TaxID=2798584 RepID=A0A8J7IKK4_9BACT|nr:hypothetical protein [Geomesophilobacter sediminis]MBJ6723108.1 hypothetical protein [Geomesophilobacter sediminis]
MSFERLQGAKGSDEPCLRGFERSFEPVEVTIGYGKSGRIRKIVTRNHATAIFGIRPGMTAAEGKKLALGEGLKETGTADTYRGDGFLVTLLVDRTGAVFGVVVEATD